MSTETRAPAASAEAITSDEPRFLRGLRVHHLMYAVLYAALVAWVLVAAGVLMSFGLILLSVAAAVGIVVIAVRGRATQQEALLWALTVAADGAMPLAPALEAFAGQCRGEFRRKVRALAHYLRLGMPLPEALAREPGLLPRDSVALLTVGWESGVLAGALREAASARSSLRPAWAVLSGRFAYFVFVLAVMEVISAFILYFITPKFEAIFNDFGLPLPEVTVVLISATHWFIKYFYIFGPLLIGGELFLLFYLPLSFYGWQNWYVPGLDRLFLGRHTGLILRGLARVVEGGHPIEWGVATLVKCYPTRWVRRRLRSVAADLLAGQDWCASLRERGLIWAADAAVLDAARRAGNLGWALRQTAEAAERRLAYRLQVWTQALFPFFVLALGALVFITAVGYFTPLIHLIRRLTG